MSDAEGRGAVLKERDLFDNFTSSHRTAYQTPTLSTAMVFGFGSKRFEFADIPDLTGKSSRLTATVLVLKLASVVVAKVK
jgi:hypothetical protein